MKEYDLILIIPMFFQGFEIGVKTIEKKIKVFFLSMHMSLSEYLL